VLKQVETVIAEVQSAFMIGIALVHAPAALLSSFTGWVTGLVASLTALPLASEYRISSLLPGIPGSRPGDRNAVRSRCHGWRYRWRDRRIRPGDR
jgi:hypothetical protein